MPLAAPEHPAAEAPTQDGGRCSVTAGYRYRCAAEPRLSGVFLYADFCTGEVFGTVPRCDGAWESRVLLDAPFNITAFGEDESGEVYVTEFAGTGSKVHLLALAPGSGGPDLTVSPAGVDFGDVASGDTVSTDLTLTNANGGPEALSLESVALTDARFQVDYHTGAAPCRRPTRCLPPGVSCGLELRLRSESQGAVSESLTLAGNFVTELVPLAAQVKPCPGADDLTVSGETVTGSESFAACDVLTVAPDVTVTAGGSLELCGGTRVALRAGLVVEAGGSLSAGTDCPLP